MAKRWKRVEYGPRADGHVLPIADLRRHEETRDCWCGPEVRRPRPFERGPVLVIHYAADGRELIEAHGLN